MSYVSRLRSGRAYGAKLHGTSASRVFSASTQNPFLLPPVLDAIFPYMTFDDLKNYRLVCSTWNTVIIPMIARRQLHPVTFSTISHQDFLTLKSEFIKFPGKVQFFQGFQLQWDQISAMTWSNFLDSFKPKALVISGGDVTDPWVNLRQLLPQVSTTLTRLELEVSWDCPHSSQSFAQLLNNLANLKPLTLKSFCLKMNEPGNGLNFTIEQLYELKKSLENLFQSQSQTLEELELFFVWYASRPGISFRMEGLQIHLPIFPRLQSLDLDLEIMKGLDNIGYYPILVPFDFNIKFPQLLQMKLVDNLFFEMMPDAIAITRGHTLKKLKICSSGLEFDEDIGQIFQALYTSFPNLEEFIALESPVFELIDGGVEIPWTQTLRILEIRGDSLNFNFLHLKKLEELHFITYTNGQELPIPSMIDLLSNHYLQLPLLKRFHLSCYKMVQEKMDEIRDGVPADFRSILTIDQGPYFE